MSQRRPQDSLSSDNLGPYWKGKAPQVRPRPETYAESSSDEADEAVTNSDAGEETPREGTEETSSDSSDLSDLSHISGFESEEDNDDTSNDSPGKPLAADPPPEDKDKDEDEDAEGEEFDPDTDPHTRYTQLPVIPFKDNSE
jgi:hypothetical protein